MKILNTAGAKYAEDIRKLEAALAQSGALKLGYTLYGLGRAMVMPITVCCVLLYDLAVLVSKVVTCNTKGFKGHFLNTFIFHPLIYMASPMSAVSHLSWMRLRLKLDTAFYVESAPAKPPVVHGPPVIKAGPYVQASEEDMVKSEREERICWMLSQMPITLEGRKIVMVSLDAGGSGDFSFGLKALTVLKEKFSRASCYFASDSPLKAYKLNLNHNHSILHDGSEPGRLEYAEVSGLVNKVEPDVVILAPVVRDGIKVEAPIIPIQEYGFDDETAGHVRGAYVAGPGPRYRGVLVQKELQKWAARLNAEDKLDRLKELSHLHPFHQQAILQGMSIEDFAGKWNLFLGYSSGERAQQEFLTSISILMRQKERSDNNLCFFFLGRAHPEVMKLPDDVAKKLQALGISQVEAVNLNGDGTEQQKTILAESGPRVRILFATLWPHDVITMIKASEDEVLTTGDQFWMECVAAGKRWVQENILYKKRAVKALIGLSKNQELEQLLENAHYRRPLMGKPLKGAEAQAEFFYRLRHEPALAKSLDILNADVVKEYSIDNWLCGMVIKTVLEKDPGFRELLASTDLAEIPSLEQPIIDFLN